MTKNIKTFLLCTALVLPFYATAEQAVPKISIESNQTKLDPAYINAAEKFFNSMNIQDSYAKMIDSSTEMVIRTNPTLVEAKKEIRAFYEKYIGWNNIKEPMIRLYAKYYSISELEEIANFYQTDVGQKTIKLLPVLFKEGQELGMGLVQEHIDELQDIVKKTISQKTQEPKK